MIAILVHSHSVTNAEKAVMQEYAKVCEQAAKAGGEVLRRMQGKIKAREKAPADLVTEADLISQETIRQLVLDAYPSHGFLGEESLPDSDESLAKDPEFVWIVDPLDGTTNYVHGLDYFCVSVALQHNAEIVVGTVYDPIREECFTAILHQGSYCNGRPIRCSDVQSLGDALVAASLPPRVEPNSDEVTRFLNVLYRCQALRRLGSAALNCCHVAAGRLDGYWATSVKKWDVAAGLLIIQEAGGTVLGIDGQPLQIDRPQFAATGHPALHSELIAALAI